MIRVVIAEDQQMLLGALGRLLDLEEEIEVVGQATNGEEACDLVKQLQPDICIMDIEMPVKSGLDVAESMKDDDCKVIMLTTFARAGYFERAQKAGVHGYLLKDSPIEELSLSIKKIMNGQRIFAPELVDLAFGQQNPLTEREKEVMQLLSDGKDTKDISNTLHITPGTVRNYISVILDKLEVSNRIEAISKFQEQGWHR